MKQVTIGEDWTTLCRTNKKFVMSYCKKHSWSFLLSSESDYRNGRNNKPSLSCIGQKWTKRLAWMRNVKEASKELKERVSNSILLNIPDFSKKVVLVTGASDKAVGAMLANRENALLKPIAFFHHTLTPTEIWYSMTENEFVAVVLAIKKFGVYLGKAIGSDY